MDRAKGKNGLNGKAQTGDQRSEEFQELILRARADMINIMRFVQGQPVLQRARSRSAPRPKGRPKRVARNPGSGGCGAGSFNTITTSVAAPNNCAVSWTRARERAMGHNVDTGTVVIHVGVHRGGAPATDNTVDTFIMSEEVPLEPIERDDDTQEVALDQDNGDTRQVMTPIEECDEDAPSRGNNIDYNYNDAQSGRL